MKNSVYPIFGLGVQSGFPTVTAQERVNCYIEKTVDGDRERVVCYGTPGLTLFADMGDTPVRGAYPFGDYLYFVHRGTFYKINNAAVLTTLGTISTTSGRVSIGCNGKQLCIVDGTTTGYVYAIANDATVTISNASPCVVTWANHGLLDGTSIKFSTTGSLPTGLTAGTTYYVKYINANTFNVASTRGGASINTSSAGSGVHTASTVLSAITSAGFPGASTICFLDGYLIVNQPNTGRYYISSLYDALNWSALDYASAESNPDNLIAVFSDHGQLFLFGQFTTELAANNGAQDFPFARVGIPIEWGLVGANSVAKMDNSVAFLARNARLGGIKVVMFSGGEPMIISTPDIERILNTYSNADGATAWSANINGHTMYVLNVGGKTFMYDSFSRCWSYLKGYGIDRHRGEISCTFLNKTMLFDYENGKIYQLSSSTYDDNGQPIEFMLTGKHIFTNMDRFTIYELNFDVETGVGLATGQGVNPQLMLSLSKDNGHTWGLNRWRSMGEIGKYKKLVKFSRLGQQRDLVAKITITDPVKRCILGAFVELTPDND